MANVDTPANLAVADGVRQEDEIAQLALRTADRYLTGDSVPARPSPLAGLRRCVAALHAGYEHMVQTADAEEEIGPAGEWLLDNYYIVQQASRLVRSDMPKGYYARLPKVQNTDLGGYPLVYALAVELLAHTEGSLHIEALAQYVRVYQQAGRLTTGEIWAFPPMLRFLLLELLAASISQVTNGDTLPEAAVLVSRLGGIPDPGQMVARCITSLRVLGTQDWTEFFESVSLVETVLRTDPAGVYAGMDEETRTHYREAVEVLADQTGADEVYVARQAIALAQSARSEEQGFAGHVGYYLVDDGRPSLMESVEYQPSWPKRLRRWLAAHSSPLYMGAICVLALGLAAAWGLYAYAGAGSLSLAIVAGILSLVPAASVVIDLLNQILVHSVGPRTLPKMDYGEGLPEDVSVIVVIPALLSNKETVNRLLQQLEWHYWSTLDPQVRYALLTDFLDASDEHMPTDEDLVDLAKEGIQALNDSHGEDVSGPFYLFHRRRLWNPSEERWMGWERKRGKLTEFNRLLQGDHDTSFSVMLGDLQALEGIRYVITLDADTALPLGAARRLVGALHHPLNRPIFAGERVVRGYTVLQPRVEVQPEAAGRSLFTRLFSGDMGVDLYTRAVSDVYQDVWGEGIFVGKGIYDLRAFTLCLEGRVPENTLLSHDLFEGIHGRAGLVSDIVLYEDYPPGYLPYAQRMHRWIRGDWQILPWLFPRVPHAQGGWSPNRLSALDRWKILDNIRRSMRSPAVLILLLAGWLILPGQAGVWTVWALAVLLASHVGGVVVSLVTRWRGGTLASTFSDLGLYGARWLLGICLLAYEASMALDAIVRTLHRMVVTRKHLLEWTTAAHAASRFSGRARTALIWGEMRLAWLGTFVAAAAVAIWRPTALVAAVPILVAWLASPIVVYWLSRPYRRVVARLGEEDRRALRRLARRTWVFFERFVGADDHWLPPDHFQEDPRGLVAHSTSPTNIGLLLLSTLAAYDLGYSGPADLVLRLRSTFGGMRSLERYRGHFMNWYSTRSLETLAPRYVSTVDSGNLVACLVALRNGLESLPGDYAFRWERLEGLLDALGVLQEIVSGQAGKGVDPQVEAVVGHLIAMAARIRQVRDYPEEWSGVLGHLAEEDWPTLDHLLIALVREGAGALGSASLRSLRIWSEQTRNQFVVMTDGLDTLMPWLVMLSEGPAVLDQDVGDDVREAWDGVRDALPVQVTLAEVPVVCRRAEERLSRFTEIVTEVLSDSVVCDDARSWCAQLRAGLARSSETAETLLAQCRDLVAECDDYFWDTEFRFLFDESRQVFHLGYHVNEERLDPNHYDLLVSEARTASLLAVAKGEVPQSHWLHLERPVADSGRKRVLLSWNGSMFEYLMPLLLTRNHEGMFLDVTYRAAVSAQIAHGRRHRVPWGVSESGYYRFDANMNYQYRGFGVPGLGRRRGLEEDLVIAPYAAMLAVSLVPKAVLANMEALTDEGMLGAYGFYEAVDYTRERLPMGREKAIVRSYMAHHQGMALLALTNYLDDQVMVRRFHSHPMMQSVDLLLQEQTPAVVPVESTPEGAGALRRSGRTRTEVTTWDVDVEARYPEAQYLSNGSYGVLITAAGGGYSTWRGTDVTRWRADTTLDNWGTWIYVRDLESKALWSVGSQPIRTEKESERASAEFGPHKAVLRRVRDGISIGMEVAVPPEIDGEIRLVTVTNPSERERRLMLVSYAELVMASQDADRRHPAFNKMFIESNYDPGLHALVFRRRPRSSEDQPIWVVHRVVTEPGVVPSHSYESGRVHFLGRGNTCRTPASLLPGGTGLSNTAGATLDPIMSLGQEIRLAAGSSATVAFVTTAASTRGEALSTAGALGSLAATRRALQEAQFQAEREMRRRDLNEYDLQRIQQVISLLMYPSAAARAAEDTLRANRRGQSGLWPFAISGDYPVLVAHVSDKVDRDAIRELLELHAYCRDRRLLFDLVFMNEQEAGYTQEVQDRLHRTVSASSSGAWLNSRGGVFILQAAHMTGAERALIDTVARIVLVLGDGSLSDRLGGIDRTPPARTRLNVARDAMQISYPTPLVERPSNLLYDNGLGGFTQDGREYVVYLEPGDWTPAPWINVVANARAGFTVSESGAGYTWVGNSGEHRLSPWRNDPVSDGPGEAIYVRDEATGRVWTPTLLPAGGDTPHLVRHGTGYSLFEHNYQGLGHRVRMFMAPNDPVKIVQVRVENVGERSRRLKLTYYLEWVLGYSRDLSQQFIVPEFEGDTGALLARNAYSEECGKHVAFVAASQYPESVTADRAEFLGRMGDYTHPEGLRQVGLSMPVAAGKDPCAALQLRLHLEAGESAEVHFVIGEGDSRAQAIGLIKRYQSPLEANTAWADTRGMWDRHVGTLQVRTPDRALDILLNRWLLYQALSCRIWGRSALYQSSGAYGFRDQLQDVMALLNAAPELAREHILEAASHQFLEGDVLHWWHPPTGRGIRTRVSDDLLWLPQVVARYVTVTGDVQILQESVPYLMGDALDDDEMERYGLYERFDEEGSLYDHCLRAIRRGDTSGIHDLPLMGAGDWNDGMNRVGAEGRGESVWLGWFLHSTLDLFAPLCERMHDPDTAGALRARAFRLRHALQTEAWDGEWYLRAYFDDGKPLGSRENRECQIDAIAQAWSILSGAAGADGEMGMDRAKTALDSALKRLVKEEQRLLLLLTPPFDTADHDPGYIRGYPPGIRENGGQYTHGAVWLVWALSALGRGDQVGALFGLLNPIHHASSPAGVQRYMAEPYVVAADVYSAASHVGRGGWTWYTGSAAWMYRLGTEAILGFQREGDTLRVTPCIPRNWPAYEMVYNHNESVYFIRVENPDGRTCGVRQITLDGEVVEGDRITLRDDGKQHALHVLM